MRMTANLTFTTEPVERCERTIIFKIVSGEVNINGTVYTISEDKGIVVKPHHVMLLRCTGTSPDGEKVFLRLRARYFWMWGHLYIAKIKGALRISEDTRMLLFLRGAAKVL